MPHFKHLPSTPDDTKELVKKPFMGKAFPHPSQSRDYALEIDNLTEKVESLEALLKTIFDGHILLDGRFVKITV